MRLPDAEKRRFSDLARRVHLSESALATNAIRALLDRDQQLPRREVPLRDYAVARDRLTIRLRPGDGLAVIQRATERGFRPASYVSALVRAHLSGRAPISTAEMSMLKASIAVLITLGTAVGRLGQKSHMSDADEQLLERTLRGTRAEIARLEERFHGFVKAALIAWEARL